ncbi:MAG: response regulator [Cyanobacteria bacterium P01_F01_bin.53]
MKFLLVEDDLAFAESIKQLLETHYYSVDLATDGKMGEEMADVFSYDLILLDWMLPKRTGIEVCQVLRDAGDRTPIILMTAQDSGANEVAGLDAGADDYLMKPFGFEELLARIRAILRRSEGIASPILTWGDLRLNPSNAQVSCCQGDGEPISIPLTPKEYGLLEVFLRNPNRIFSMDALIDKVWSFDDTPTTGAIRTHIKGLRQKMKVVGLKEVIDTVYGLGYRLSPVVAVVLPHKAATELPVPLSKQTANTTGEKVATHQPAVDSAAVDGTAVDKATIEKAVAEKPTDKSTVDKSTVDKSTVDKSTVDKSTVDKFVAEKPIAVDKAEAVPSAIPEIDLLALWQPVSARYLLRVENLAKTLRALSTGVQKPVEQEDIATEAHTLAGSLGSFGFSAATPQCREIERIIRDYDNLGNQQLQALTKAITNVQQMLIAVDPVVPTTIKAPTLTQASQVSQSPTDERSLTPSVAKLLIVDDDPAILTLLEGLLHNWGLQIRLLNAPQQLWMTMEQFDPDMVVLDVEMPHLSGFDLCQMLRNEPRWSELPILFLTAHTEAETIQKVFSIGADDYIRKPIVAAELIARVLSWLERARNRKLKAEVDNLTGVANRQKSTQEITRLLGLAERYGQSFCLAVIDIDSFKRVNTEHGHAVGDRILRQFGACLRDSLRDEDIIARWGGEEFIVGLYGVDQDEGNHYLNNFLKDWQTLCNSQDLFSRGDNGCDNSGRDNSGRDDSDRDDSGELNITFSTGIAVYPRDATNLQALYQAADRVLSEAKAVGRNRILAEAS